MSKKTQTYDKIVNIMHFPPVSSSIQVTQQWPPCMLKCEARCRKKQKQPKRTAGEARESAIGDGVNLKSRTDASGQEKETNNVLNNRQIESQIFIQQKKPHLNYLSKVFQAPPSLVGAESGWLQARSVVRAINAWRLLKADSKF